MRCWQGDFRFNIGFRDERRTGLDLKPFGTTHIQVRFDSERHSKVVRCEFGARGSTFMQCDLTTRNSHDLLSNPLLACAVFCLPAMAMVAAGNGRVGGGWRTAVWT